ncbi:Uncharacterised protein [Mycobacteroides abscessus subsp. abscessus]|nr:Uncharacterised protein [Mycobacteroides abscessus subsp. abscessus]SHZ62557.1 Uncharacterised protein [Mycobacteroides abscessus subsp. abscessus]SKT24119.1 Uncharacterised protein [Mycobacteroides abscessus subsp. abscessus]SKT95895.1 Uncharacterised protein [Mycobacteroides abscessus subsp. abscessus]SKZ53841.1 Uncharacterised protein [Mycobacteroides abscessus subsp. abscessus]
MRSIWPIMPFIVLYMVNMVFRMFLVMAIMGGSCSTTCGISLSMLVTSSSSPRMLSVSLSMPSRASNSERMDQHIGISKQCFSQYR